MNIVFEYLYRDAGNYKNWESVVFSNPRAHDIDTVRASVRQAMSNAEFFDAPAARLPDLHFPVFCAELDVPLHEFFDVSDTDQAPDDLFGRSIDQLLVEIGNFGR
ncbi:hypothetical protein [Sulfuritalea sp.]|uniref:hypothetical protein n=1 Tax=Sulfuritalea sp. TaxID=2480090 RepID=UPI001ACA6081|nr:hypothetical protein [Sulfuritalea sp.]MBN8474641.1 hypothetical protein [Sulfuritalea sp.]